MKPVYCQIPETDTTLHLAVYAHLHHLSTLKFACMKNIICWFEIYVKDIHRARAFCTAV